LSIALQVNDNSPPTGQEVDPSQPKTCLFNRFVLQQILSFTFHDDASGMNHFFDPLVDFLGIVSRVGAQLTDGKVSKGVVQRQ
jgi:hypothetical protein